MTALQKLQNKQKKLTKQLNDRKVLKSKIIHTLHDIKEVNEKIELSVNDFFKNI